MSKADLPKQSNRLQIEHEDSLLSLGMTAADLNFPKTVFHLLRRLKQIKIRWTYV